MRDADAAMYRAKEAGGGRLMLFDEVTRQRALTRLHTEAALRRAIEHEEFRVYFQPEVSVKTGSIVGLEALVRWEHPERGIVGPDAFIALAEETGLIVPIGTWVLREACRLARGWQAARGAGEPLVVRVNVSARQLAQDDLIDIVADAVRSFGLDPAHLCLEVTESVLVVKIDRSFVRGIAHSTEDMAIVNAVIELGHALGLSVTAEGVETDEQLSKLQRNGCGTAQGFLFSRPECPDVVDQLLR